MIKYIQSFFCLFLCLIFWYSCDKEISFVVSESQLSFSKDTVYLDTVFSNIGSSTYNLKVYNNSSNNVVIPQIRLKKGLESLYRLNVDGIYDLNNGAEGKIFENIELLANDSLYIFIETTINIDNINTPDDSFVYEDQIEFFSNNNTQEVELITLVKDAVFIYPQRFENNGEYFYETLSIDLDGDGIDEESEIRGRFLENDELHLNNDKPYVIYGYAAVGSNQILTIDKGARIHFHRNSGIIVGNGGSIQVNGELSNSIDTSENEVIIQGDRLEPYFENIPGQWGLIWLMDGSLNNKFNFTTIKNASIGIYSTGGQFNQEPQLTLENVKVFNSSSFGILARASSVDAHNLVINKSGQSSFAGIFGGKYNLNHCTIANYWTSSARQFPSLLFNDYYIDLDNNGYINEFFEMRLSNSIIYGNQNIEFLIEQIEDSDLDFIVYNSLFKFYDSSNFFGNNPNLNFDSPKFNNVLLNLNPSFVDPYANNLAIDEDSEVIGLGSINYAILYPFDLNGYDRTESPDPGAYQHQIIND
mgnify:FL=1|jgi:hypothetical protein|tara:strand:+ start:8605 stop:10194 length:1590 start_codon:yes stop_codon:yes gene_type:complete